MKKNKLKLYVIILLTLFAPSCNGWLDISPENVVTEEELFKEATGFYIALNGIYKQLGQKELYGREMTFGTMDVMGQVYAIEGQEGYSSYIRKNSPWHYLANFNYSANQNTKDIFEQIWEKSYNTIVNCNNIINNIDALETSDFKHGEPERAMIKGEALALRALIHVDMLRIFAASPSVNLSGIYIPYVTEFPYYGGNSNETTENILKLAEKDLLQAVELLKSYDDQNDSYRERLGIGFRYISTFLGAIPKNIFFQYRGYRMNYIAVMATTARMYSYWGKHEKAISYAQSVIDFKSSTWNKAIRFPNSKDLDSDAKFSDDIIFCLSYPTLVVDYDAYVKGSATESLALYNYKYLWEGDIADPSDYRLTYQINVASNGAFPIKHKLNTTGYNSSIIERTKDMIPMIRLSEMYFIIAEKYAAENDFVKAASIIQDVRVARNCKGDINLGITDKSSFNKRLLEEVRREYFAEGQTFFYYKKLNEKLVNGMMPESFIVPIPDGQNIN